jgi:hypothetical protein
MWIRVREGNEAQAEKWIRRYFNTQVEVDGRVFGLVVEDARPSNSCMGGWMLALASMGLKHTHQTISASWFRVATNKEHEAVVAAMDVDDDRRTP